ncbi:MAG: sulfatase [Fulvivirga sp.]
MKTMKVLFAGLILTAAFVNQVFAQSASADKPNIVLIMGDDLTFRDIEPYGSAQVHTPNMAKLAQEGMSFDNMFTTTPMCAPTRQQIFTGMFPVRNGAFPNHGVVYDGTKSIAHHMQALGYNTGLIGKKHFGPASSFPFQDLGGQNHDSGEGIDLDLSKAEQFVKKSKDKPYLLIVTSNQPHGPLNRGNSAVYPPEKIDVPPHVVDTRETRKTLSDYFAEITYLDSLVGVCMDIVERSGEKENTIVIFTTEQGSGLPFGKWTNYDTGLKTGFIARWPGKIPAGRRTKALTQYVDVVPTLIDLAGGDPEKVNTGVKDAFGNTGFDGRSFEAVLTGKSDQFRDYVYGVQTTRGIIKGSESYPIRSVRSDKYLYIHNLNPEGEFSNVITHGKVFASWFETGNKEDAERAQFYVKRPEIELYDVKKDPYQLKNIADDASLDHVKEALKGELAAFMKQQGDLGVETEMKAFERQPGKKDKKKKKK